MQRLRYRIRSEAPLIFSARFGDANMVGTLRHIPGTSVAGMLAARYIRKEKLKGKNAADDPGFYRIFVKGDLRFENAFLLFEDKYDRAWRFRPVPNSVHQEKQGEAIYDLLFIEDDEDEPDVQTKPVNGFCNIDEKEIRLAQVKTHLNFHHSRERESGRPREGMIFNYESMDRGQLFEGEIIGSEPDLRELVRVCGTGWIGHAGRSRNAQYGKSRFEFPDADPEPINVSIPRDSEISLTFLSDTIIYNENGFSATDVKSLEALLGGNIHIRKAFIKESDAETFFSIWRMKKPSERCFAAGSCFLLEGITEADEKRLAELQIRGIGARTHEGYGQCIFGWQKEDELNVVPTHLPEISRPRAEMPKAVKEILTRVIQDTVKRETKLDAMVESSAFKESLPKNSLIGRLHGMARQLDKERFVRALDDLRDTARKQLESCRTERQTLLDYLKGIERSAEDVFSKPNFADLNKLSREIGYDTDTDARFQAEIYQLYMTTFFASMRKSKVKEGKHE